MSVEKLKNLRVELSDDGLDLPGCEDSGISVIGDVHHRTKDELRRRYDELPLREFLTEEAAMSIGNYLIIEDQPKGARIVTAPGYASGYLTKLEDELRFATTFGNAIEGLQDDLTYDIDVLVHTLKSNIAFLPAYSTFYEEVNRAHPAYVFDFADGQVDQKFGYLHYANQFDNTANSFGSALDRVASKLAQSLERQDRSATVMFSGGVDSTSLLLAMRKYIDEGSLNVVTCDWGSSTNGPLRAKPVAESLNVNVDLVESDHEGWPPKTDEVIDHLNSLLSEDLFKSIAPHWSVGSTVVDADDVLLSGQNLGVLFRGGAGGNPEILPPGFRTSERLKYAVKNGADVKQALLDYRYSNSYIRHQLPKEGYRLLYKLLPDRTVEFDSSKFGYFNGLTQTGGPNVTKNTLSDDQYNADSENDIKRFFAEVRDAYDQQTVNLFLWYWYNTNCVSQQGTLPVTGGSYLNLPAMWGPFAGFFQNWTRGATRFISPKKELYEYVKKETGRYYHDLTGYSPTQLRDLQSSTQSLNKGEWQPTLASRNQDLISPENSVVLQALPDDARNSVEPLYQEALEYVDSKQGLTVTELGHATSVVNVERIVRDN